MKTKTIRLLQKKIIQNSKEIIYYYMLYIIYYNRKWEIANY